MTDSQQPTVVLVHGAFADASGFAGIFRELVTSGYDVVAPPNPLRSLASDAAALNAVVSAIHGGVSAPAVGRPAFTEKCTAAGGRVRPGSWSPSTTTRSRRTPNGSSPSG